MKSMKLTFIGAAHEVTGSCHLLEASGKRILIDCGMEQGVDIYENQELPIAANEIDYLLLTHAHIDHSGKIPLLVKNGFAGDIICTFATADLCSIMLLDSAHIQESEAEWKNRKAKRKGDKEVEPLYTIEDAKAALELFAPIGYNQELQLDEGVVVSFTDVGHLLGSAAISLVITEGREKRKLVFSGDIGNINQPILRDPQHILDADYLVIESTYGDRVHQVNRPNYVADFTRILRETFSKGGNVVIPSFAVGRTQELLYFIREIKEKNYLPEFSGFRVYVDSPLAIEATKIFHKNYSSCFDEEALALIERGINPLLFQGLVTTVTAEESKAINFDEEPKVIISASGMCEAGRIRHHLKHNLWKKEATICFVGYQAEGTLGRKLLEGAKEVKLFGEEIEVNAKIISLKGVSGHADQKGLLNWIRGVKTPLKKVFVVHGEDTVTDRFASMIEEEIGVLAFAPYSGGEVDLLSAEVIRVGEKNKLKERDEKKSRNKEVFDRVNEAAKKLLETVHSSQGMTNKDLEKLEKKIEEINDMWNFYRNS